MSINSEELKEDVLFVALEVDIIVGEILHTLLYTDQWADMLAFVSVSICTKLGKLQPNLPNYTNWYSRIFDLYSTQHGHRESLGQNF